LAIEEGTRPDRVDARRPTPVAHRAPFLVENS